MRHLCWKQLIWTKLGRKPHKNLTLHFSRICDEDDDLAEVTPETVPNEVREWLAATFTRQNMQSKREKPKFKSVANAILTVVDKVLTGREKSNALAVV